MILCTKKNSLLIIFECKRIKNKIHRLIKNRFEDKLRKTKNSQNCKLYNCMKSIDLYLINNNFSQKKKEAKKSREI
jgi:hypothetical protein